MDRNRLERFRQLLLAERRRLTGMRENLREFGLGMTQGGSIGELSTYDNHPADIGSETFERGKDLAIRSNMGNRVLEIDEAMARIEAGTYGKCVACGGAIDEARLEAMPETKFCKGCKERLEKEEAVRRRVRPIEEEALRPPFGRGFRDPGSDEADEYLAFDAEDTWQAVARYGTSETPQDVPDAAGYEEMYIDADERQGGVEDVELIVDEEGEVLGEREQAQPAAGRTGRAGPVAAESWGGQAALGRVGDAGAAGGDDGAGGVDRRNGPGR